MQGALKSNRRWSRGGAWESPRRMAVRGGVGFSGLALLGCVAAMGQTRAGAAAPAAQLKIDPTQIVSPVSPTLYGMMTEEINHAFDGGLYAEMLQNRTFRASWQGIEHWTVVRQGEAQASMEVDQHTGPSKALPYSV